MAGPENAGAACVVESPFLRDVIYKPDVLSAHPSLKFELYHLHRRS